MLRFLLVVLKSCGFEFISLGLATSVGVTDFTMGYTTNVVLFAAKATAWYFYSPNSPD
jgi:hypothetical protein